MNDNEKKVPLADNLSENVSGGLEEDCHVHSSSILRTDNADNQEDSGTCTQITKFIR